MIRIDTASNRTSVMGMVKYESYKSEFELSIMIRHTCFRSLRRIGGSGTVRRKFMIQISFKWLGRIIDLTFLIFE